MKTLPSSVGTSIPQSGCKVWSVVLCEVVYAFKAKKYLWIIYRLPSATISHEYIGMRRLAPCVALSSCDPIKDESIIDMLSGIEPPSLPANFISINAVGAVGCCEIQYCALLTPGKSDQIQIKWQNCPLRKDLIKMTKIGRHVRGEASSCRYDLHQNCPRFPCQ